MMDRSPAESPAPDQLAELLALGRDAAGTPSEQPNSSADAAAQFVKEQLGARAGDQPPEIEGYRIIERLGEGGMGVVWQAVQLGTHREVAIKLLSSMGSPRARARFEREVELAATLDHPNIARVYDSGLHRGAYYYAMELVRGVPLDHYVREHRLSQRQILQLMGCVCAAVQHAHQRGVIHRDLKPGNILVSDDGQPHVLDFGLAKAFAEPAEADLTLSGEVAGTVAYMAPEQAAGHASEIGTPTDVCALGAILYELLTGAHPRTLEGSRYQVLQRVAEEEVRRPRQFGPAVDKEMEAVLLKALALKPADRYATAGELGRDIENYLAGDPLMARPPTTIYFLKKRLRKYRGTVAVAALVLAALIFAGGYSYFRVRNERGKAIAAAAREHQARGEAEAQRDRAERSAAEARAQRQAAELRLGQSRVAEGDALLTWGRAGAAKRSFAEGWDTLERVGAPVEPAVLGLWDAERARISPACTLSANASPVGSVAISSDGKWILSGSEDGAIRLWDVERGCLRKVLAEGERSGQAIGATRSADATRPADAARPALPPGRVCVCLSRDGQTALSGSADGLVRLWDVNAGTVIRTLAGHTAPVSSVALDRDGKRALSSGKDNTIRLWDLSSGQTLRVLRGHLARAWADADVTSVGFSPDGQSALSGAIDSTMRLWNLSTGEVVHTFAGHRAQVTGVAITPDGKTAISASRDRDAILWDVSTGALIRRLSEHGDAILAVACSSDGRLIASAGHDRNTKVWRADTGELLWTLADHDADVLTVAFAPNGQSVISGGRDGTIKIWDLAEAREMRVLVPADPAGSPRLTPTQGVRVALSADALLAATARDNVVSVWDVATGKLLTTLSGHTNRVLGLAFSPDGRSMLTASMDRSMRHWDLSTSKPINIYTGHLDEVRAAAFSPDGKRALSAGADRMVRLWNLTTGNSVGMLLGHNAGLNCVAFSPDGRTALSGGLDNSVRYWDLADRKALWVLSGHAEHVRAVTFSPDGSAALSTSNDDTLRLWNLEQNRSCQVFIGHANDVFAACFTGDGRMMLSASLDGTVRLWDVAPAGESRSLAGPPGGICYAAFSAGGGVAITSSLDGNVHVWDFGRPRRRRAVSQGVATARMAAGANSSDPAVLVALGEWHLLRGRFAVAAEFLQSARAAGARVSSVSLGRCYWALGRPQDACREFALAIERKEAPETYLALCISAARRESTP